jgi:WD40 repeat protein
MTSTATGRHNPYIGPRAYRVGEPLFGRDHEVQKLLDLLIAERIVLLYSPSGAGKTSLIQAGLIPRLRQEDFLVLPGNPQVPVIRVNQEPTPGERAAGATNRYVFSALRCLERSLPPGGSIPLAWLVTLTLPQFLQWRAEWLGPTDAEVLIFDQFEEVLTVEPGDRAGKEAFFDQVGAALRDRNRWALFSMREDYVAALDPYLRRIPRRFGTRFRLDLLGRDAAMQAIRGPAERLGVSISEAAAGKLVGELSGVRVQRPDGTIETREGVHVEPVQLQVVCFRLWEGSSGIDQITEEDIGRLVGDVDTALAGYYADRVAATAGQAGVSERAIRDWVEGQLITDQGIRGQVLQGHEASGGLDNRVIAALIDAHLVRAEERRGATWFELAHDRLIEPIRKDNASWRERTLSATQRRALLWGQGGRPDSLLFGDQELADAQRWAVGATAALTALDQEFLDACRDAWAQAEERRLFALKDARERQRLRLIMGLSTILALTLILGGLAVAQWLRAERHRRDAERLAGIAYQERARAEEQRRKAEQQREGAVMAGREAEGQRREAERLSALLNIERGLTYCEQGEVGPGILCLTHSLKATPRQDSDLQRAIRTQLSSSRSQLHVLHQRLTHRGTVRAVAFRPDGKAVLTGSDDATAQLWDAATGEPLGKPLRHQGAVRAVAFRPDGQAVLTGSDDATAQLWDAATGKPLGGPLTHPGPVKAVAFRPDGQAVLTGSDDGTAQLWDAATGKPLGEPLKHRGPVKAVAFRPDGKAVVVAGGDNGAVRLWDPATGRRIGEPLTHQGPVWAVAIRPDGKAILTGSEDRTAQLWDAATGQPIGGPLQHQDPVKAVAFRPDGRVVLTGSEYGTARLWDAATGQPIAAILDHRSTVWAMAIRPDGQAILTGSEDKTARLWETATAQPMGQPLRHQGAVWAVAFRPDGRAVLTGSDDHTAQLWDAATRQPILNPLKHVGRVTAVAFSPDGKVILTGTLNVTARLWDAASAQPIAKPLRPGSGVMAVAFSPDGKAILTGTYNGMAQLWDAATRQHLGEPLKHQGTVWAVAFRPDSRAVLTGSEDGTARLWDAATGRPLGKPLEHQSPVRAVAFRPDGKVILTGSSDRTARLWDAATGQPLGKPLEHRGPIWAVAFGPDGKAILTGSSDRTARLWDAATGQPLGKPLEHQGPVWAVAFRPDGKRILTGSDDGTAQLWDVPTPMEGEIDRIVLWSQVVTGQELDERGVVRFLDDGTWRRSRQELQRLGGPPPP